MAVDQSVYTVPVKSMGLLPYLHMGFLETGCGIVGMCLFMSSA